MIKNPAKHKSISSFGTLFHPCSSQSHSISFRNEFKYWWTLMGKKPVDINLNQDILTPEEVAQYLRKSTSWVYKNWQALGGRKLRGSLFFPRKEDLYERLFGKRKGVALRLHPEGDQVHGNLVQNQNRGKNRRGIKKKGAKHSPTGDIGVAREADLSKGHLVTVKRS
jgi:hypothetical protein